MVYDFRFWGTSRTCSDVRFESVMRAKTEVRQLLRVSEFTPQIPAIGQTPR